MYTDSNVMTFSSTRVLPSDRRAAIAKVSAADDTEQITLKICIRLSDDL